MRISRSVRALPAALAAAIAALAPAPDAAACDCALPTEIMPKAESAAVPSNTKVWIQGFGCPSPTLQKSDGASVPTSTTLIGQTTILHPDAELEVGSTYVVAGCSEFGVPTTSFTVTEGPDNDPPPVPTFSTANPESGSGDFSSCGDYNYVPLIVDQKDKLLALDIAGRAKLDPSALSGDVQGLFFPSRSAHVGDKTCDASTWSFEADGEATDTKLAAFDLAGNFSGWSSPQTIDAGCGCEVAGGARPAAGGYVLAGIGLAAIALRRRRRRAAFRLVSSADPR